MSRLSLHFYLNFRHSDYRQRWRQLEQQQAAQNALVQAYQVLQERATEDGAAAVPPQAMRDFDQARQAFRDGRYVESRATVLRRLQQMPRLRVRDK